LQLTKFGFLFCFIVPRVGANKTKGLVKQKAKGKEAKGKVGAY